MSEQVSEPHAEPEVRSRDGAQGRTLERILLALIAAAVVVCAGALVLTARSSMRAADAQRDQACYAEATTPMYDINFDLDPDAGLDGLQDQQDQLSRQQDLVRTKLQECGVELPADDE